jgi:hypothetical protein
LSLVRMIKITKQTEKIIMDVIIDIIYSVFSRVV